jgi:hypothetical protein
MDIKKLRARRLEMQEIKRRDTLIHLELEKRELWNDTDSDYDHIALSVDTKIAKTDARIAEENRAREEAETEAAAKNKRREHIKMEVVDAFVGGGLQTPQRVAPFHPDPYAGKKLEVQLTPEGRAEVQRQLREFDDLNPPRLEREKATHHFRDRRSAESPRRLPIRSATINNCGLTLDEWMTSANVGNTLFTMEQQNSMVNSWRCGEDPTDWAKVGQDQSVRVREAASKKAREDGCLNPAARMLLDKNTWVAEHTQALIRIWIRDGKF